MASYFYQIGNPRLTKKFLNLNKHMVKQIYEYIAVLQIWRYQIWMKLWKIFTPEEIM